MTAQSRHVTLADAGAPPIVAADLIPASEWHYCTIKQLGQLLRQKKISAVELLEHTIARIEALDQRINAVVVRDFERARQAAAAADIALGRGDQRKLLGIPMTIKEAFNVAGLPTTWGFRNLRTTYQRKTRSSSPAPGARVAFYLARPMCPWAWETFKATMRFTEPPTIPGTSAVLRAVHPEDRPLLSPRGSGRCRSGRTLADRCAYRRISAASTRISRHLAWSRFVAMARHHPRHCLMAVTSPCSGLWQDPRPISSWRST
jgi:hypothetical protein